MTDNTTNTVQAKRRKLSNFLINPSYQLKYIFWLALTGLLLTAINCGIFYIYIRENYDILVDLIPMTDRTRMQLYDELHQIVLILAGFSAFFTVLVALLGLVISHRTAGPLYHFKRVFDDIRAGNKKARVKLRPRDDFKDVADSFNQMIDEYRT